MTRIALIALALTACAPAGPVQSDPGAAQCKLDRVQYVIGQPRSDALAEQARRRASAKTVRYIEPDMIVTMEFRAGRLSLYLGTDGRIGSVTCG